MEDFNPRSPIRLSDIDNLLQESIFESSDGAKLVEYLKKKRGGGRVRLQNIFQQVPVQRAQFNFNLDTSEPTPLPESPQPTTSNGDNVPEVVVTNGGDVQQETAPVVVSTVVPNGGSVSPRVPIVIVNDLNSAKKPTVKQIVLKSPGPMNTLSRQLLINQYQRTNAAKCELLKQLASSTPKPESNGSIGRMSTFTTSISPITEGDRSPLTPVEEIPSSQPVASPVHVIVVPPAASQEVLVPCSQPILVPCSQAVPTDAAPKKVVVLKTVTEADEVIIPETPSPVKVVTESPKAPPNHVQPRRLSTTFKQMEMAEEAAYANGQITSDESEGEEDEEDKTERGSNSVLLKSILKDTSMGGGRSRHSMRVSFSKQLVQQREISPAPDIPEAVDYLDSNSSDDSDVSESDYGEEDDYQVVDEVYTDDDGEDEANLEHYEELKDRICELNNSHNSRRSVSPLIDVVKETPVQWFETTTPTKRRDQQATEEQQFPPQTTAKKDNKTNLQLVDIITDWDDEEDEEEADHGAGIPESEPSQESLPEPRASTNSNNHETNLDTMDISSSNLEDSVERLVELPPDPNALIEEEGVLPEEHIYPAAVDEQMPILPLPITTEELVDVLSGTEQEPEPEPQPEKCSETETPNPIEQPPEELPPPPETPVEEPPRSPDRVITPPVQFTSSAKRRYIQQNEVDLISRLQNDLPLSQASSSEADISSQTVEEPLKSFEKVSETLVEIAQSFRDQPPAAAQPTDTAARKLVQPPKRGKKSTVDPVTASYFEAIEKTFAKPKAPPSTTQLKKTEPKRKLYDATLSEVTEDDESMRGQVAKPAPKVAATVRQDPKLRNLKIVVEKLKVEDYLPKKKSQSRPMEPESEVAGEPVVVQEGPQKAALKSRRASKDKDTAKQNDSAKKPKGRPRKVRPASVGEVLPETERPVEIVSVDVPTQEVSKKKHKPNLVGNSQQQHLEENMPNGTLTEVVENGIQPDKVVEKKKRSKPNQREESQQQQQAVESLPNENLVEELSVQKDQRQEKKKSSNPNLAEDSQQQRLDESLLNGTEVVEHDPRQNKVVEKKKRTKPAARKESQQQQPDEVLPAVDGELGADVEQNTPKDKVVEKKKRTKPAQREESQQQQRPDEVLPAVDGELVANVEQEVPKDKTVEKKKPAESKESQQQQQQQQPGEVLPAVDGELGADVEQEVPKDKIVEKKKRTKPAQREESQQQQQPDEVLPAVDGELVANVEQDEPKDKVVEKKKRTKPAQRKELQQQQQPDQILPAVDGELVTDVEQDTPKDKIVEKKKRAKPAGDKESQQQQRLDENLPAVSGESVTDVEHDIRKDKHNEKKKKLKPNLAAVSQAAQPEQPPTVSVEVEVQQGSTNVAVVVKKQKMRPNFGTKSKQQHVEVPPAVDEENRVNAGTETGPLETPTVSSAAATADTEAVKQKKKQSRKSLDEKSSKDQQQTKTVTESLFQPETQLKALKVKVAKMAVIPASVSMSPASKAILQKKDKQPVVQPSPATARKLFDEPETERDEVQVAKKSRKAEKKKRADEDSRNKRKETKRAKLKPSEPIPKVRISAEKDGLYRITTPGREVDLTQSSFAEQLNVTELDESANIRSSLEGCQEEFLGFEDDEDTIPNMTVDLSRSNLELIIPLEPARIPKSVKIPPAVKKSRKPQRQSRSPARKQKMPREPRQPKRISGSASEPAPKATSPERAAADSQLENRSLPLKKRKSRDSSKEYLPSEDDAVFAKPAPVDLNDSLLIPMLQRVPIADKYVVRSTPDRGTESTTEYDTDDTCGTGDNVLIVRKDTSRLNQSRLSSLGEDEREEEEEEERGRILNKKPANRRPSIPLPRFYGDNTFDITWKPRHKAAGASRKNKRRLDNDSGIEEEDGGVVRRSKRTCRISKQILMTNPLIKSAYDRPDYRPMTVEQLLKAEKMAKKLKQEEKVKRQRKPVGRPRKPSRSPRGRKRIQEPEPEAPEDQQQAKRNRIDLELPAVPTTSSSSSSETAASSAEVAVQVDEDLTVQQERQQAQTWMMKLMAENSGREEVMPQATSSGDRMHFTLDHLTFQERNGIQYSFFIYSETENFGFLRFAPAAVKKWTKTADFLLKFLVLNGQLSFQINGKETVTKSGDFLMLPQNTRYRIQNSDEISLVFMIKFRAATNELPSM